MNVLERDFFTDPEIIQDPVPYYRALHERGPVVREPHKGVFMLSRIDEILEVYTDHERFSAIVGPLGPLVTCRSPPRARAGPRSSSAAATRSRWATSSCPSILPSTPGIARWPAGSSRPTGSRRTRSSSGPSPIELIDEFADRGEVEFCRAYARPFTLLVIADLLGVPREDHETFRGWLGGQRRHGRRPRGPARRRSGVREPASLLRPLHRGAPRFAGRRRHEPAGHRPVPRRRAPRGDGRRAPRHHHLRRRAGDHGAPARRGNAVSLPSSPPLAEELRSDPEAIPNFVEECLRLEGPIKGSFRLALRDTRLAGVDIPAGSDR